MSECYLDNHPLIRDGRSQSDRSTSTLLPSSVKIDDRDLKDFLSFLSKYAQQVIFHETNGKKGDWTPFFENITPIRIALISQYDLKALETDFLNQSEKTNQSPTNANLNLLIAQVSDLFSEINAWQLQLKTDESLGKMLRNLITSDLSPTLSAFLSCLNIAKTISNYNSPISFFSYLENWNLSINDLAKVDSEIAIKVGNLNRSLALKDKLEDIFHKLFKGLEAVVLSAPSFFEQSLLSTKSHTPHFALLISFLRLFKHTQNDINSITQKHLDFFYRQVLQLKEKVAIPDKAHLIFETAKKIDSPLKLDKGSLFKDGKDSNGVEIKFSLDNDLILDKAQVVSLQTLFFHSIQTEEGTQVSDVFIAPIANSADGKGEDFTTQEIKSWPTVGAIQNKISTNFDNATFGIAFAAKVLYLKEGNRTITLTLTVNGNNASILDGRNNAFKAYLSGEKGWIEKDGNTESGLTISATDSSITFIINLDPTDDPVSFYDATNLEDALFPTNLPVLKLILNPDEKEADISLYHYLRDLEITNTTIHVSVIGVRDIVVQNDNGIQDINSSFMPFGALPKKGANFYIGSNELFSKDWGICNFNIEWEESPALINEHYDFYIEDGRNKNHFTVNPAYLKDGVWVEESLEEVNLFNPDASDLNTLMTITSDLMPVNTELLSTNLNYSTASTNGFIRLGLADYTDGNTFLEDPFLIEEYAKAITRQSLAVGRMGTFPRISNALYRNPADAAIIQLGNVTPPIATDTTWIPELPNPPYIPVIKTLSLDYQAMSGEALKIFHLYPFEKTFKEVSAPSFLPDFRYETVESGNAIEGNLFVGIEKIRPGGQLNLLFQIAEGSANPEQTKARVQWWYLANNEWFKLRPDLDILSDTTNGLIQSGIIQMAIPFNINQGNTLMPADLFWLKASVQNRSDAIGETIAIHTQAASTTFLPDPGNDLQRLNKPLDAEQISKPLTNIPSLKGLIQPYPSFGGRASESAEKFYTRVSEHLRHKGRAITLFDYERLVLQNFPNVYKVKCIPHTMGRSGKSIDHTLAPGFVTIVVVPDLSNLSFANKLAPKVPLATLEKIEGFLKNNSSPFARIKVLNPRYESVDVCFKVKFRKGKNEVFYQEELKKGITDFLSPWATAGASRIVFGGKIFKSTIINFIENQAYVDYLKDFEMSHLNQLQEEIIGNTARSVLKAGKIIVKIIHQ